MEILLFIAESLLLGIGLAMDACAVSMSNGLNDRSLKLKKILFISFFFGLFQGLMPLIGYFIGSQFISYIENFIPWIAIGILGFLGGKMIFEAIKNSKKKNEKTETKVITLKVIFIQTIATSIDALSVGITIADYEVLEAVITALIIAVVTFLICIGGHFIGKKFGDKLGNKANILGGIILILIGIEIFVSGMFF